MNPITTLHNITNGIVSQEYIKYMYKNKYDMKIEETANWIVESISNDTLKEQEKEWKEERRKRLEFAERVGVETPKLSKTSIIYKPNEEDQPKKIRYHDNNIVTTKGEKYVLEKKEEWDGGSRGKVKTKGKRGKGFV